MNQNAWGALTATLMKFPSGAANPADLFKLPGSKLFFQREMRSQIFVKPVYSGNQDLQYDLQVSPDGNPAVVTMRMESDLMVGDRAAPGEDDDAKALDSFGTIQFSQKLTIDLRPDVPVITDFKISQNFDP